MRYVHDRTLTDPGGGLIRVLYTPAEVKAARVEGRLRFVAALNRGGLTVLPDAAAKWWPGTGRIQPVTTTSSYNAMWATHERP